VTKGLLLATGGASLLASFLNKRERLILELVPAITQQQELWRIFTFKFIYLNPGELVFGSLLLYVFRTFERQLGSAKFGVRLILV
jgi:membrane associated rhomboid family serine protease